MKNHANRRSVSSKAFAAVLALALVMSVNYLAILLCPFIVDLLTGLFGKSGSADFPFVLNAAIVLLMAVVGYRYRESYVFGAPDFSE